MAKNPRKLHELREYTQALRGMDEAKLQAELRDHRSKLMTLRMQAVTEKVEDNSEFTRTRHQVARVLTELSARRNKAAAK